VFPRDENASTGLPDLNRTGRWIYIDEIRVIALP
jgi:hypothetical protein